MPYAAGIVLGGVKVAATPITVAFPPANAGAGALITAGAANFIATHRADQATIAGAGAPYDGQYNVIAVLSATEIVIQDNGTFVAGAAAGTIQINSANITLTITDEATPNWLAIATALPDFVRINATGPNVRYFVYEVFFGTINITHTVASSTTVWTSEREIVFNGRFLDGIPAQIGYVGTNGTATVRVGREGTDTRSASFGGAWVGFRMVGTTRLHYELIGSYWGSIFDQIFGTGGRWIASVIDAGGVQAPAFTHSHDVIESSVLISDDFGLLAVGPLAEADNILISSSANFGAFFNGTFTVSGVLKSDDAFTPIALLAINGDLTFLDPKEDYTAAELFSHFNGPSVGRKSYTWNPRFVIRDETGKMGDPVQGLNVQIFEINESTGVETQIAGSPFTSDASGRINTSGVILQRLSSDFTLGVVNNSQRVRVEADGYRAVNEIITMRMAYDADYPIDKQDMRDAGDLK